MLPTESVLALPRSDRSRHSTMPELTKTEAAIMGVLRDGYPHRRQELKDAFDAMAEDQALRMHISNMRKKLAPAGKTIASVYLNRQFQYQLFRFISYD